MNPKSDLEILEQLEQVEAKQALHSLNARFARALDRLDRCLMASLWTDDAEVDCAAHQGSAKGFVVAVTTADAALERSFTSISNEYFEVTGDTAIGEVYMINVSTLIEDGAKVDRLIGGRYLDSYRREDGQWKIARRTFVHDWNMTHATTAVWDEGLFGLITLRGQRDRSDPVYALLEQ